MQTTAYDWSFAERQVTWLVPRCFVKACDEWGGTSTECLSILTLCIQTLGPTCNHKYAHVHHECGQTKKRSFKHCWRDCTVHALYLDPAWWSVLEEGFWVGLFVVVVVSLGVNWNDADYCTNSRAESERYTGTMIVPSRLPSCNCMFTLCPSRLHRYCYYSLCVPTPIGHQHRRSVLVLGNEN